MQQQANTVDTRRFIRAIKQCKWVYITAIVLFTSLGIWISVRSLPKADIQGSMLIGEIGYDQENRSGGISQMMKTFSVGGFSASTVDNEVMILQSHDVMVRTVRTLGLNRQYIGKTDDGEKALLYRDMPVRVEAPAEYFDSLSKIYNVKLNIKPNGKVDIKVTKGMFGIVKHKVENASLPMMLDTPYGTLQILPTELFGKSPYTRLTVTIKGNDAAATELFNKSTIDLATKMSDIINVDYRCANIDLGKATVNGIMTEYNAKRLDRLHEASIASIKYYDERIAETFKTLQAEEKKVSEYQRKNELMGIDSELGILVGEAVNSKSAIQTANYNIAYYETVLNILRNRLDDDVIIPQMESLDDPNIGAFNGAIQARRDLRRSATEDNNALILLNQKIEELRNLIIENSAKMIAKAKADVQHQQNLASTAQGRLDKYPDYQLEFMNLVRDKDYQNQLYQYLVNQRENSVLQLYSSTNIGFVFQEAYVVKQGGLLRMLIWPVALFIFALFATTCLAVLIMLLSRKVKDPIDLAFIGIDNNAVKYDGTQTSINRLRTLITSNPNNNIIYYGAIGDSATARDSFIDSLLSIGRTVEIISGLTSNDEILTPTIQKQINEAQQKFDYVIIDIPNPENVADIENVIDNDGAILIMSLTANTITRKKYKSIISGQTAKKVFTLICQ